MSNLVSHYQRRQCPGSGKTESFEVPATGLLPPAIQRCEGLSNSIVDSRLTYPDLALIILAMDLTFKKPSLHFRFLASDSRLPVDTYHALSFEIDVRFQM